MISKYDFMQLKRGDWVFWGTRGLRLVLKGPADSYFNRGFIRFVRFKMLPDSVEHVTYQWGDVRKLLTLINRS